MNYDDDELWVVECADREAAEEQQQTRMEDDADSVRKGES